MTKHTIEEMEKMPAEQLRLLANQEAVEPEKKADPATPTPKSEDQEVFVASREIDLGDGSGVQVFEAEGASKEEALEALSDKIAEAQKNATIKIRQQEAELRDLRAKNAEREKPKEPTADEEYVLAQEFQKMPRAAFRKMFEEMTGMKPEEFRTMQAAARAYETATTTTEAINTFVAMHPDYEDAGTAGDKNGKLMRMKLAELRLPITSENLAKAYLHLKESGLLALKGDEAHSDAIEPAGEVERIVPDPAAPAPQRTRKVSTIGTHSRVTPVAPKAEPSLDDAYNMPMDKLKELANRQLAGNR
jgi:hypothetical protein